MDRSLGFYHGLLQFPIRSEEADEGHRLAYLGTGSAEILLIQQPHDEQNPLLERGGGQVMKFRVDNLPLVANAIEAEQIRVLRGLEMAIWGERTLLVADPDGYAVLLAEPVGTAN